MNRILPSFWRVKGSYNILDCEVNFSSGLSIFLSFTLDGILTTYTYRLTHLSYDLIHAYCMWEVEIYWSFVRDIVWIPLKSEKKREKSINIISHYFKIDHLRIHCICFQNESWHSSDALISLWTSPIKGDSALLDLDMLKETHLCKFHYTHIDVYFQCNSFPQCY